MPDYASCNVKFDSLTFINFNKIIKLPKYISTQIMLFHSITQYLIVSDQLASFNFIP